MTATKHRSFKVLIGLSLLIVAMLFANLVQGASLFQPSEASLVAKLQVETNGNTRISYHRETEKVRFIGTTPDQAITLDRTRRAENSPEAVSSAFLAEYGQLFGLSDPDQELVLASEQLLDDGRSFTRYQQVYEGVPIIGGELIVQTNAKLAVVSANGEILPDLELDTKPTISAEMARQTAAAKVAKDYELAAQQLSAAEPVLSIYNPALLGGPGLRFDSLVWQTEVTAADLLPLNEYVLIDAQTGGIVLHFSQIHTAKNRVNYDNNNNPAFGLPGSGPLRSEGQGATGVDDIDRAYDYAGDTYDFFWNEHGRDSLNNAGMSLVSTTRYCPNAASCPYINAFWNGSQMVYGAGFAAADDVVGHELTHGVTDFTSRLFYYYQSGAINESFSDIWGEFVDLTNGSGNDAANVRWKMGEDIPGIGAIRDMKNPPIYGDPDRMLSPNYYCNEKDPLSGAGDSGGVHHNSGINNKAAYLMVDGDTFNGQTVNPLGMAKVADLYYHVQTNMLTTASDYNDLYDLLIQASIDLAFTGDEKLSVKRALDAVEMNQVPTSCGRPEAPVCEAELTPNYLFSDDFEAGPGNWKTGGDKIWQSANFYATSPNSHLFGRNFGSPTDGRMVMVNEILMPSSAYMHFNHAFGFESTAPVANMRFDGGVLEYSANGGPSWTDAGPLFTHNGYNGTLDGPDNPLGAVPAFTADSWGYTSSRLDLSSLAGQSVRFRFRIGTDASVSDYGWFVDDVQIYTCDDGVYTPTPTATATATATSTPTATPTGTREPARDSFVYLPVTIKKAPGS